MLDDEKYARCGNTIMKAFGICLNPNLQNSLLSGSLYLYLKNIIHRCHIYKAITGSSQSPFEISYRKSPFEISYSISLLFLHCTLSGATSLF